MVAFHLMELRFLLVRHCLFLLLNVKKTIRVTKVDVIKDNTRIRGGVTRFMNVGYVQSSALKPDPYILER